MEKRELREVWVLINCKDLNDKKGLPEWVSTGRFKPSAA
jgi:hypothetical protein